MHPEPRLLTGPPDDGRRQSAGPIRPQLRGQRDVALLLGAGRHAERGEHGLPAWSRRPAPAGRSSPRSPSRCRIAWQVRPARARAQSCRPSCCQDSRPRRARTPVARSSALPSARHEAAVRADVAAQGARRGRLGSAGETRQPASSRGATARRCEALRASRGEVRAGALRLSCDSRWISPTGTISRRSSRPDGELTWRKRVAGSGGRGTASGCRPGPR